MLQTNWRDSREEKEIDAAAQDIAKMQDRFNITLLQKIAKQNKDIAEQYE